MDEALAGLARKYRTMAEIRRDKLRTGRRTPREAMRSLAREFPGALRELDVLPLREVDRRAAALEVAARDSGPTEPWMRWMARQHALLRAALRIKAHGRGAAIDAGLAARLAAEEGVDVRFALRCARPPGGRLNALVLEWLIEETGATAEALTAALSPKKPTAEEIAAESDHASRPTEKLPDP